MKKKDPIIFIRKPVFFINMNLDNSNLALTLFFFLATDVMYPAAVVTHKQGGVLFVVRQFK